MRKFQPGHLFWIIFILIFFNEIFIVYAQNRYTIPRIQGQVILDGLSDETAWKDIPPLPVTMHSPMFGKTPTEKTEILIGYNDDHLYVAGRLFVSDPALIQSTSKKRDFFQGNCNWFGIILDTFNDKENGMAFFTTPTGLRLDLTIFNDAQGVEPINVSWNTFWDVETSVNDEGWFVEMCIPFTSLRFQSVDGKIVMGLIAWRWIPKKSEQIIYPAIPPDFGDWSAWKVSLAQEVVLRNISNRNPLYIAPYVLGGHGHSSELNDDETAYEREDKPELEFGLDVKYGLTRNLTADVTLNTDFAQVEADDQQINLTRFSLFFPEKRLFFQERSSNFEFNMGNQDQLFYSRRIGIHEEEPVRIYGGGRIVGRIGPWDVGFLNMQTASRKDLPAENFGVLRLRRQVINPNTYIGSIVTSRLGTDSTYNIVYGLDGIFRLFGEDYLKLHWAQCFDDSLKNDALSLNPARLGINWERRSLKGLAYDLDFSRTGTEFDPGMGFLMREDYTRVGNRILYGWFPGEQSPLFRHDVFLSGFWVQRNSDKKTESSEIGPGWEFMTKSSCMGKIEAKMYYENLTDTLSFSDDVEVIPGRYTFSGVRGQFQSPMGYRFFAIINLDAGSFYDGSRFSLSFMPYWSISSDFEVSGCYQFNRVSFSERSQRLNAHIGRLRVSWTLNIATSFSTFIQYNSASNSVITNIRFRYNPREGNDLYLVFDQGLNTNRYRQDPIPPALGSRTLLLKYTYTFNMG